MEENSNTRVVQGSDVITCLPCKVKSVIIYTMEKIKESITKWIVNRIFWDKKLESKVQNHLDKLLKQIKLEKYMEEQDYH